MVLLLQVVFVSCHSGFRYFKFAIHQKLFSYDEFLNTSCVVGRTMREDLAAAVEEIRKVGNLSRYSVLEPIKVKCSNKLFCFTCDMRNHSMFH